MITIKTLTKAINDGLNALAPLYGVPFVFAIKSEGGEYTPPKRKGNAVTVYINGIVEIVDSEVIPSQGVTVCTQTVRLQIVYPLPDDIEPEDAISPVRSLLDAFFQQTQVQSLPDESGKQITVSCYANIPTTGEISLSTGPGLMCSFACNIYYNFIQDGVNSANMVLAFEGVRVPYMDATITRVPVMEANPYSDSGGSSESLTEATALNIEFSAPTLQSASNALFAAFKAFILTGTSPVYTVTVSYENTVQAYRMKFGQSSLSLEGVKNGNSKMTLVEARELNYGDE